MAAQDILPTIILIGILYALYKWLTGPKTPSDPFRGVTRPMVESVTSAFPDVSIESVVFSLSRTRNPQTTSEIILDRGTLPAAPADFVVPDHLRPVAVRSATPASSSSTAATAQAAAVKQQSLIDRYNLSSRLAGDSAKASASPEPPTSGGGSGVSSGVATPSSIASGKWEATREDREKDLRARKERMILEARRKILEKEAKEAAAAADKAKAE